MIGELEGRALARFAREAIAEALGGRAAEKPAGAAFHQRSGTFVTLRRNGTLHGCIGALEPRDEVLEDVRKNAVAAALLDPRAPDIALADVPALDVEVSLLTPLQPIEYDGTEEGALAAIVPFRDGVVVRHHDAQATFLPQVWESIPDRREFMRSLKIKAGLSATFWSPEVRLYRYASRKFTDRGRVVPS